MFSVEGREFFTVEKLMYPEFKNIWCNADFTTDTTVMPDFLESFQL